MTRNDSGQECRQVALSDMQIGTADPASENSQKDVPWYNFRTRDIHDFNQL
ncbi:hypothetical protein GRAN_2745 [Granulicella sibirica]|uniref:Uncharacterized protein n=1 Tax=Granulicella sibirica TaxID=2479048 RepID=A0A4Q0T1P1_9BACT|nr:hypothetical protein GRAN_2745 [Granulicella sibirica]